MSKDIYELARDANQIIKDPGFCGCRVESAVDWILAFEFDSTEHAHRFCAQSSNRSIPPDRQTTVLGKMPKR